MEIEYIMALITLGAVVVSFISVQTAKAQIAASIEIANKQIVASTEIAERQIKAQLVSANRQKWMETLRTQIVDVLSASIQLTTSVFGGRATSEDMALLDRVDHTVRLGLDPNDELHETLSTALEDLSLHVIQCANDVANNKKTPAQAFEPSTFAVKRTLIHEAAQEI